MIRFVIPPTTRRENIPRLLADLAPRARELGARVIFVDDGSTDGTAEVDRGAPPGPAPRGRAPPASTAASAPRSTPACAPRSASPPTTTRSSPSRPTTPPTSTTCRACSSASTQGSDVVLASVYAPGGRIIGVAPLAPGGLARRSPTPSATLGGLQEIHTLSSLYRVYRAGTLRRAAETYGYLLVREPGFAANVELLLKLYNAGAHGRRGADGQRLEPRARASRRCSLKPTVLAYGRLMAAHLVGRIQPPPISPLAEHATTARDAPPARRRRSSRALRREPASRRRSSAAASSARRSPCASPQAGRATSRCSSAARRSAAWPAPSTSAATGSTASTT